MSWEQFMHQEGLAPEVTIRHIGETMADAVIENNGSVEEFEKKIRGFLDAQVSTRISP
jgi:dephospho-CoA kinase